MGTAGLETIALNEPSVARGPTFMETLWAKASGREWSEEALSLQDLSDLLWAANGINRPEELKCTASSAQNAHDVQIYLFMKEGVYRYDVEAHALEPVLAGDHRSQIMMSPPPRPVGAGGAPPPPPPPPSRPPLQIVLVSDISCFRMGPPELKCEWGAIDAGIVSQNISLFCAATGLRTRPRASMDKGKIKGLLELGDSEHVLLEHPVGYPKERSS